MIRKCFMIGLSLAMLSVLNGTAAETGKQKLKIFILAGQSNMVGHSHYRTVPAILDDKDPAAQEVARLILKEGAVTAADVVAMIETGSKVAALKARAEDMTASAADQAAAKAELEKIEPVYAAQTAKVQDAFHVSERVYINAIADNNRRSGKLSFGYGASQASLGPELGFGMSLEKRIDGPILLIKTSWGGKSLHYDFRPPSAGAYELDENQKKADDPAYLEQIARDRQLYKQWLVKAEKAIKAFWVEHDKFMVKNLDKEKYARWRQEYEDWERNGIEANGGYANLQPWMVWARERMAQKFFAGTDLKAPTMTKTLWQERPKLADAKTGDEIRAEAGTFYRQMTEQVHAVLKDLKATHPDYDPEAGYEIAGFVWFQGFNDQFSEAFHSNYKHNMTAFIQDVRQEFGVPDLPFVIGVLGTTGTKEGTDKNPVSMAQRATAADPQWKGTVRSVESYIYFDHEAGGMWRNGTWNKPETGVEFQRRASDRPYHYMGGGPLFTRLGDAMARAMAEVIGSTQNKAQ